MKKICDKKSLSRELIRTIPPWIIIQAFRTGSFVTGNIMLSRTNAENEAACALIFPTKLIAEAFYTGGLIAVGSIVGRKVGSESYADCGKILRNGQLLGLLYTIPSILAALNFKNIFQLPFITQPEETLNITETYYKIFVFAFPATALLAANEQFGLAIGKPIPAILAKMISYGVLFGSAYFLVPKMQAEGLAISYVIQSWTNFLTLEVLQLINCDLKYGTVKLKNFIPDRSQMFEIVKVGFPIAINRFAELSNVFANTILVGRFGESALKEWNVPTQYLCILVVFLIALSKSATIGVSKSLGTGNPKNAKAFGYLCNALGLGIALSFLALFLALPNLLIEPFIS